MGTVHILKIMPEYFVEVENGNKSFELRKDDRGFEVDDIVIMEEVKDGEPTGMKTAPRQITYIFKGGKFGLSEGYCIFESKPIGSMTKQQPILPQIDLNFSQEVVSKSEYMKMAIEKGFDVDDPVVIALVSMFFFEGYQMANSIVNQLDK